MDSLPVVVLQESSYPVSFEPVEGDWVWFRSKGKLYSLIKEWRGSSECSRVQDLPGRPSAGLFGKDLVSGEGGGVLASLAQLCCWGTCSQRLLLIAVSDAAPLRAPLSAHGPPAPSWITVCAQRLGTGPLELKYPVQPLRTGNSGLKCRVRGLCTWHPKSKWN